MHDCPDNVCAVELTYDFQQFVAIVIPREGGNGLDDLLLVKIYLQATILSNEDEVVKSINVQFLKELVKVLASQFTTVSVKNDHRGVLGLVFEQVDISVQKGHVRTSITSNNQTSRGILQLSAAVSPFWG